MKTAMYERGVSEDGKSALKVILVGIGAGASPRVALNWADMLAQGMGLRLRLIYEAPDVLPLDPLFPRPKVQIDSEPRTWVEKDRELMPKRDAFDVGLPLPLDELRVAQGNLVETLLQEATKPEVALVVAGNLGVHQAAGSVSFLPELLRHCRRPLLAVGALGHAPVVLAATDCNDPSLPVLRQGIYLATALGGQLVIAHNVGTTAAADLRGKVGSHPSIWLIHESPVLGTGSQVQCEGRLELH